MLHWVARRFVRVAVVIACATAGLALADNRPAAAYALSGCTWGMAPVAVTYEPIMLGNFPADHALYLGPIEEAANHISSVLPGRVKLLEGTDTGVPIDIKVYVANEGWDPETTLGYFEASKYLDVYGRCWYTPRSRIVLNRYYLNQYLGIQANGTETCDGCEHPPVVNYVILHEFGHGLGLEHTSLDAGIQSHCNIMYGDAAAFEKDGPCAAFGLNWKLDDIQGGEAAYPLRTPDPGCVKDVISCLLELS